MRSKIKLIATKALAKKVFREPSYFIAFGFGSGLSPAAPGTCGTLVAIPLYLLLVHLSLFYYFLVVVLFSLIGIYCCGKCARELGIHDYSGIVWDEVVGFLWTLIAVPFHWLWIVLGFALFRLFDIWKPWPIAWLDKRVMGGLGIMLDDWIAAIYAGVVLQLIRLFLKI